MLLRFSLPMKRAMSLAPSWLPTAEWFQPKAHLANRFPIT